MPTEGVATVRVLRRSCRSSRRRRAAFPRGVSQCAWCADLGARPRLPGPLAETLTRPALTRVLAARDRYWVCEKSDGERAMALSYSGSLYLVDRSFSVTTFDGAGAYGAALGNDTLIDGEVLDLPDGRWFYMFDVVAVGSNATLHTRPFSARLETMSRLHDSMRADARMWNGPLRVSRKYFSLAAAGVEKVFRYISGPDAHGEYHYADGERANLNDGIVFTPDDQPYMCAASTLFKWKWAELNTIDFKVMWESLSDALRKRGAAAGGAGGGAAGTGEAEVVVEAFVGGRDSTDVSATHLALPVSECAALEKELRAGSRDFMVVECAFVARTGKWRILRKRPDKNAANFSRVAFHTLEVLVQNVTKDELQRALPMSAARR